MIYLIDVKFNFLEKLTDFRQVFDIIENSPYQMIDTLKQLVSLKKSGNLKTTVIILMLKIIPNSIELSAWPKIKKIIFGKEVLVVP